MSTVQKYKLVFFSPAPNTRAILDHLFRKYPQVLGKIGHYEQCAFISRGTGQYHPTEEAQPAIGTPGQLVCIEEDRVELIVIDQGEKVQLRNAVQELKKVHPYEEVEYDIYRLEGL
ncbi:structural toxin protein [Lentinula edodes]|uniref:ATP phosphoribosyltransferase n=2 Tax=Lentinula TaxID=5352 RepID=A0A1Q3DW97_LENED|nr:uncharacterized protein C8R40DRAFT_1119339 [Lentinula edodes]KAH7871993.1 hypothetical protein C8R40DRAFT_1119339 [Lentinula edodes]KAJ3881920.1 hypothetical protein F5051DRAFT_75995 [Lentinula edodes]KAJ3896363.1 hypothetical protein GG344DRAFT_36885 [Lentinula edodes]KAJ3923839.1 hypothetical protein F5877DRAFT_87318 [Lentinula edodes]KAJ4487119.1 hypothetical protein C8J55DRAFT_507054 [Lentinula edodes]